MKTAAIIMFAALLYVNAGAQSNSSIQFWDTTAGQQIRTGNIGWSGNATTGYFFVQTPQNNNNEVIKSTADGINVNGNLTVTNGKFVGDGSGLQKLPNDTTMSAGGSYYYLPSSPINLPDVGAGGGFKYVPFKITVPASGTVVITADVHFNNNTTTYDSTWGIAVLSKIQLSSVQDLNGIENTIRGPGTLAITRTFDVTAGQNNFVLNASSLIVDKIAQLQNCHITCMFFRNSLSVGP